LESINVVTLLGLVSAWLVPGWVNHLGAEPGTQLYSTLAHPLWLYLNGYPAEVGEVNRHIAWYTSLYPWSCSVCWCLAVRRTSLQRSAPTYGKW